MSTDNKVLDAFYQIITESKQEMFDRIAANRTRYLTVVLETIMKDHNASAVLRTCDCFGVQDLHAIEKGTSYEIQREIARGAGNWVDLHTYASGKQPTIECLQSLRDRGYRIVATSPHAEQDINDLTVEEPIALVFGTERDGISPEAKAFADELVRIPMYGFTESFNISVSVAIALNILRNRLEHSEIGWQLTEAEQTALKIKWSTKIVRDGENVEKELRKRVLEKE